MTLICLPRYAARLPVSRRPWVFVFLSLCDRESVCLCLSVCISVCVSFCVCVLIASTTSFFARYRLLVCVSPSARTPTEQKKKKKKHGFIQVFAYEDERVADEEDVVASGSASLSSVRLAGGSVSGGGAVTGGSIEVVLSADLFAVNNIGRATVDAFRLEPSTTSAELLANVLEAYPPPHEIVTLGVTFGLCLESETGQRSWLGDDQVVADCLLTTDVLCCKLAPWRVDIEVAFAAVVLELRLDPNAYCSALVRGPLFFFFFFFFFFFAGVGWWQGMGFVVNGDGLFGWLVGEVNEFGEVGEVG